MQQVGVETVVKGLIAFLGDLKKINRGLDGIRPHATLLQRAFGGLLDFIGNVGREILNVIEFTLGQLLADAINFVISKIGELVQATIDAGNEFQTLELRLNRLNFNDAIESGMSFNDAQRESIKLTKEQLAWLQRLAATTPYDNTDISNVFTLARSYGFAAQQAQQITEDVSNFAAGMGLGNTEIERIIINFGQMVQLGKVTQRELNDLARGSFVPVNDVLKEMEKQTGMTRDELEDFLLTSEGVDAFMDAFSGLVKTRFAGAAEAMAKTFSAASANALDMVKSIGGLNIVKPILDTIGARISDFVSKFTENPEMWNRLVSAAKRVGTAISSVVDALFGLLPGAGDLADKLVTGMEGIARWIEVHRPDILKFFRDIAETIRTEVIPFVRDKFLPALEAIWKWVVDNRTTIMRFFETLGNIVKEFFKDLLGGRAGAGPSEILDNILKFMNFVIDNESSITKFIEILYSIFLVVQLVSTVFGILINGIISVVAVVLSALAIFSALSAFLSTPLVAAIGAAILAFLGAAAPILLLIVLVGLLVAAWTTNFGNIRTITEQLWFIIKYYWGKIWEDVSTTASQLWFIVKYYWNKMWESVSTTASQLLYIVKYYFNQIVAAIRNIDWVGLGESIMSGIIAGVSGMASVLADTVRSAALGAIGAASAVLDINSPSKVFMEMGKMTMLGMAEGIEKAVALATTSMSNAMQSIAAPAMMMPALVQGFAPSGNTTTNNQSETKNYNLTVNTSGRHEQIVQDFGMLQSMQGF